MYHVEHKVCLKPRDAAGKKRATRCPSGKKGKAVQVKATKKCQEKKAAKKSDDEDFETVSSSSGESDESVSAGNSAQSQPIPTEFGFTLMKWLRDCLNESVLLAGCVGPPGSGL